MSEVRISDVVVPELFTPYDSQQFLNKNLYIKSGVAFSDPRVSRLMNGAEGGNIITLPFWKHITANEPAIASDDFSQKITCDKITAGAEIAVKGQYAKGWSAMDLSGLLAGSNPMTAIANLVDDYWLIDINTRCLKASVGIVADSVANHDSDLVMDLAAVSGTAANSGYIDANSMIDARGYLGDRQSDAGVLLMHSVVYTNLQKQQLINFIREADNNTLFPTYNGMRVLVDDAAPVVSVGGRSVYYTFMYGPEVFSVDFGFVPVPQAVHRDENAGNGFGGEQLYTRRSLLVHPRGYKVNTSLVSAAANGLSYAQLAASGTFERVWDERKRIKFVAIKSLG